MEYINIYATRIMYKREIICEDKTVQISRRFGGLLVQMTLYAGRYKL